MCDSVVIVGEGAVWLAKNSDREPSESQAVEHVPATEHPPGATLRCTHIELPQVNRTHAITISRPTWMWGCEMGVNEHGLAVANEAVFTRMPIADVGLTSMDMQRLALERCRSADDALELIIELLQRWPQGGRMSHSGSLRYHGSFLLADPRGAWVLETAGQLWAAVRVRGCRSISNALTIEHEFDRIHPDAYATARARGFCRSAREFSFARCFGRELLTIAGGARVRAARTRMSLSKSPRSPADAGPSREGRSKSPRSPADAGPSREGAEPSREGRSKSPRSPADAGPSREGVASGPVDAHALAATLRDHAGTEPSVGLRMHMPCAHASWLPTRAAGQTTASMIARLGLGLDGGAGSQVWMTGTSSPCLSVFKPVPLELGRAWAACPPARADADSLWWRHERFHRAVLADWQARREVGASSRARLEARAFAGELESFEHAWAEHRCALPRWIDDAMTVGSPRRGLFEAYWRRQSRRDGMI